MIRVSLGSTSHLLPKEPKPVCLRTFLDQSHCKPWTQTVSTGSVATSLELSRTALHKKRRKPQFIHIVADYIISNNPELAGVHLFKTQWLHSYLTIQTVETNTARQIFHERLSVGLLLYVSVLHMQTLFNFKCPHQAYIHVQGRNGPVF